MSTVATSTPKTPEQKHTAARQSQTMGRFGGVLILMLFLGLPALAVGMILYGMTTRDRRRYAILLIGMLLGMAVVGLSPEFKSVPFGTAQHRVAPDNSVGAILALGSSMLAFPV